MDDQDKPRPRAPTLAGIGPSSSPPVVGAVGRPTSPRPSEVTLRMFIERPPPDAEPHAGPPTVSPEAGAIDNPWRDDPRSIAPVQLGTVPPPPLVLAPMRAGESTSVRGARRRTWWVALAVLALCVGVANLRAYLSVSHSVAAPGLSTGPTAAGIASAPATTTFAPPLASSAPSVAETPPALPSTSRAPAFDAIAAKQALDATASAVARCQSGQVPATAYSVVTFGNDGAVVRVAVSPPFLGTSAGRCVTRALFQTHVAPFVGDPGIVVHHFVAAAQ